MRIYVTVQIGMMIVFAGGVQAMDLKKAIEENPEYFQYVYDPLTTEEEQAQAACENKFPYTRQEIKAHEEAIELLEAGRSLRELSDNAFRILAPMRNGTIRKTLDGLEANETISQVELDEIETKVNEFAESVTLRLKVQRQSTPAIEEIFNQQAHEEQLKAQEEQKKKDQKMQNNTNAGKGNNVLKKPFTDRQIPRRNMRKKQTEEPPPEEPQENGAHDFNFSNTFREVASDSAGEGGSGTMKVKSEQPGISEVNSSKSIEKAACEPLLPKNSAPPSQSFTPSKSSQMHLNFNSRSIATISSGIVGLLTFGTVYVKKIAPQVRARGQATKGRKKNTFFLLAGLDGDAWRTLLPGMGTRKRDKKHKKE